MINAEHVLRQMRLTEKSNKLSAEYSQYTFEVAPDATKYTVREAVEQTFKVRTSAGRTSAAARAGRAAAPTTRRPS